MDNENKSIHDFSVSFARKSALRLDYNNAANGVGKLVSWRVLEYKNLIST
jgi:hypothetical protein